MHDYGELTERELDDVSGGDCAWGLCFNMSGLGTAIATGATRGAAGGAEPPVVLHEPTGGNKGSGSGIVLY